MNDLSFVLGALTFGRYQLTSHAKKRMLQRNISHQDIRYCARSGIACLQPDGRIQVVGTDTENVELTIICVIESDVLIITLF